MSVEVAVTTAETLMPIVKKNAMEAKFGDWKKQCEEYMAGVAKKEGIKELGDGVYYEVLTEGTGAVPADTNRVSVNYEGKLLNDTIFDSSYKRGEPAKFRCNQVIPGWTKALTNMPVGSSWMVYIPQEQAYGSENRGEKLPPFSCLIFKIDLLGIE
jgi:FKBP-type peptidyl-prolyl cis-trans isomerase FklB